MESDFMKTVKRKVLVEVISQRIADEMDIFEKKVLLLSKYDIYALAYEIDSKIRIYESLLYKLDCITISGLQAICDMKDILDCFYQEWVKTGDSTERELDDCMEKVLSDYYKEKEQIA